MEHSSRGRASRHRIAVGALIAALASAVLAVGATPASAQSAPTRGTDPPGVPNGVGAPENVFGTNDLHPVQSTTTFPNRAIGLLALTKTTEPFGGGTRYYEQCTAFMVGPRTALTAAHCLVDERSNNNLGYQWAYSATFSAGAHGFANEPYGRCDVIQMGVLPTYLSGDNAFDSKTDLGAIRLDCRVGRRTGTLGWWALDFEDEDAIIRGYPGGGEELQYTARGPVTDTRPQEISHTIDTLQGNSGSPLFNNVDPDGSGPYPRGVYAFGVQAAGGLFRNYASRISTSRYIWVNRWNDFAGTPCIGQCGGF